MATRPEPIPASLPAILRLGAGPEFVRFRELAGAFRLQLRNGQRRLTLVAAVAWRLERRRPPPGHCACGYNLTGNVSGTCPECVVSLTRREAG